MRALNRPETEPCAFRTRRTTMAGSSGFVEHQCGEFASSGELLEYRAGGACDVFRREATVTVLGGLFLLPRKALTKPFEGLLQRVSRSRGCAICLKRRYCSAVGRQIRGSGTQICCRLGLGVLPQTSSNVASRLGPYVGTALARRLDAAQIPTSQ